MKFFLILLVVINIHSIPPNCQSPNIFCVKNSSGSSGSVNLLLYDSLQEAIDEKHEAGDKIYLEGGEYSPNISYIINQQVGNLNNPVEILPYDHEHVIMNCPMDGSLIRVLNGTWKIHEGKGKLIMKHDGDVSDGMVYVKGCQVILGPYHVIVGNGGEGNSVMVKAANDNVDGVVIDGIVFETTSITADPRYLRIYRSHSLTEGVIYGKYKRIWIKNCVFKLTGLQRGIFLYRGSSYVTIENNYFYSYGNLGPIAYTIDMTERSDYGDLHHVIVQNNLFDYSDVQTRQMNYIQLLSESRTPVRRNIHAFQNIKNIFIQYNTFICDDNSMTLFKISIDNLEVGSIFPFENLYIQNNLFKGYDIVNKGGYMFFFEEDMNVDLCQPCYIRSNVYETDVYSLYETSGDNIGTINIYDNSYLLAPSYNNGNKPVPYYRTIYNEYTTVYDNAPMYDFDYKIRVNYSVGCFEYILSENGEVCNQGNWEPDTSCSECKLNYFNEQNNCGSCIKDNYDPLADCSLCINGFDITSNCTSCLSGYIDDSVCDTCKGNRDITTKCTECLNYFIDDDNDCGTCLDGFDDECLNCINSKLSPENNCSKINNPLTLIVISSIAGGVIGFLILVVIICLSVFSIYKLNMKTKNKKFMTEEIELIEKGKKKKKKKKKKGDSQKQTAEFIIDESLFKITSADIKLLEKIGEGGSTSITILFKDLCSWKGKKVCAKLFRTSLIANGEYFADFEKELSIVSSISHPNIVCFYGACTDPPRVMLVLEYCKLGDLANYISLNKGNIDVKSKIKVLLDVATALEYLHERKVIHRDVKPENILLTEQKVAKITDFGLSRVCKKMTSSKTRFIGSSYYMSPEVITTRNYTEKIDVYSYSMVCYVLIEETLRPFTSIDEDDSNVVQKVSIDPSYRPVIHDQKFTGILWAIELITNGWKHEPNERQNFTEIRQILQTKI